MVFMPVRGIGGDGGQMTDATPTPLVRLARLWWLLVSAIWIVGFALLLRWSPADEIVYRVPIDQAPMADPPAPATAVPVEPQMPFLTGGDNGQPDARRAEVRAQMAGESHLAVSRPNCWSSPYSAPDAAGTEMQWRCATPISWSRMILTNLLVLASFPILLPMIILGTLRVVRRISPT
jgi:hypothetical protein